MNKKLDIISNSLKAHFEITGSKSESNRMLILQKLFDSISISNLSESDDSKLMQAALSSNQEEVYIGHAGTAMRFLTSYFAVCDGRDTLLTGSSRMKQRPIGLLVDALRDLGADIQYAENEGFPPLRIKGKKLQGGQIEIDGSVSSQYVSSLLLVAGSLTEGLNIKFLGKVTSVPYIKMTLALLTEIDVKWSWKNNVIQVFPREKSSKEYPLIVESDWSSASYHYSMAALAKEARISIKSYKKESLQGDSALKEIYKDFGVRSHFDGVELFLNKSIDAEIKKHVEYDLSNCPDIAQTIAVTCFGLGISCNLYGLHTLKIKETDRLVALQNELSKFGASIEITEKSLHLKPSSTIAKDVDVATYEDHRMAMAFAPLCLKTNLNILEAEVVSKSYPTFWKDWDVYRQNT
ncbi:MAG: 3-phosphoshikimate 1-carboxyvinyltransferase [Flavobacteriaceae bacterium]